MRCGEAITYVNDESLARAYIDGLLDRQMTQLVTTTTPISVPTVIADRIPAIAEELQAQHSMTVATGVPCPRGSSAYRAARNLCPDVANNIRRATRRSGRAKHDFNDVPASKSTSEGWETVKGKETDKGVACQVACQKSAALQAAQPAQRAAPDDLGDVASRGSETYCLRGHPLTEQPAGEGWCCDACTSPCVALHHFCDECGFGLCCACHLRILGSTVNVDDETDADANSNADKEAADKKDKAAIADAKRRRKKDKK